MEKLNFTFLTDDQIFDNNQLDILKKYGTRAAITDFAILLGGFCDVYYTSEGKSQKNRTGWWWTKTPCVYESRTVSYCGRREWTDVTERHGGVRPALSYSSISSISANGVRGSYGILEVEYGEYPQTVVSKDFSRKLEKAYLDGTINKTDKEYTTDSVYWQDYNTPFQARTHVEYEYNGKKYIRFVANFAWQTLSDGTKVKKGKSYWVEVEPIRWLIDEKANIALSKCLIVSGLQFKIKKRKSDVYQGDFENTEIYRFMNDIFAKDIIPSVITKEAERQSANAEENKQIVAKLQEYEQLQQELDSVQREKARLIARESKIKAQIEQKQTEIQGKGQYVKQ